jgi:hypothetical protein
MNSHKRIKAVKQVVKQNTFYILDTKTDLILATIFGKDLALAVVDLINTNPKLINYDEKEESDDSNGN